MVVPVSIPIDTPTVNWGWPISFSRLPIAAVNHVTTATPLSSVSLFVEGAHTSALSAKEFEFELLY
jgi:hypothetical protein